MTYGYSIQRDGHVIRFWVNPHPNMKDNLMKIFFQRFLASNSPKAKQSYRIRNSRFQVSDSMMMRQTDQQSNKRLTRDGNVLASMENGAESHS